MGPADARVAQTTDLDPPGLRVPEGVPQGLRRNLVDLVAKDRVQILRRAFMETMKDPEFLADATKAKLDINPLDGAELERNVNEVFNLDKSLIPRAKEILK